MSLISFEACQGESQETSPEDAEDCCFWYFSSEGSQNQSHAPRAQDDVEGDLALPLVPKISSLIGLLEAKEK